MRTVFRSIVSLSMAAALVFLAACSAVPKSAKAGNEIITQKPAPEDKLSITIMVKNAFSINTFEKEAEKHFPWLNIIQVGNFSSNMGLLEYEARLENDDLTDMVMTWPLEIGEKYWADRLMDLSSLPLSSRYNTSMLDTISREGKLYYLPGPSQVRAIVYNKTLFAEKGWSVPKDFNGFIDLCHQIEDSGIRSLQLGFANSEVLDTAFVGYSYADCYSKPEDARWISDYAKGTGSFGDHFRPALDTFQTLIDEGVLKKEDLNVFYQDREDMLFSRRCAMVEDSVLLARAGFDKNGCTDEFGLMPFFNPGENGDWARLYPVCYIGLNKHLEEPQNKEKLSKIMELLDYISTPEGQLALAGDTGAMFSSLQSVPPPDIPEIADILPALQHGRFAVFPTLKNAQTALRNGLAAMLEGEMTADDVIKTVDRQNLSPPVVWYDMDIGFASESFSLTETGSFVTDCMRAESGSDIALFIDNGKDGINNGKGLNGRFYKGGITHSDIDRIMPDLRHGEKGELYKITMSGENLIKTLEYSIPVDNDICGWFYYFSGLKMKFDPSAKRGSRILSITDDKDEKIDPERMYSIAIMDGSVPEEFIATKEASGKLIKDVISDALSIDKPINPPNDGRFIISNSK
ncbi:MAG: extracellular solute-binding protein [Oscillospiraceae bacterium]